VKVTSPFSKFRVCPEQFLFYDLRLPPSFKSLKATHTRPHGYKLHYPYLYQISRLYFKKNLCKIIVAATISHLRTRACTRDFISVTVNGRPKRTYGFSLKDAVNAKNDCLRYSAKTSTNDRYSIVPYCVLWYNFVFKTYLRGGKNGLHID